MYTRIGYLRDALKRTKAHLRNKVKGIALQAYKGRTRPKPATMEDELPDDIEEIREEIKELSKELDDWEYITREWKKLNPQGVLIKRGLIRDPTLRGDEDENPPTPIELGSSDENPIVLGDEDDEDPSTSH